MRGHQVDPTRLTYCFLFILDGDQEEGRQRHDLPAEQEQDAVTGHHQQCHARSQQPVEQSQPAAIVHVLGLLPVTEAVNAAQQRDQENGHEEDGRQTIQGHAELGTGEERPGDHDGLTVARSPKGNDTGQAHAGPEDSHQGGQPLPGQRGPIQHQAR